MTGPRRFRATTLLAIVGFAGAGTMTVELSAVRLLAPWFGASMGVWTNVIGVILLALSLGYLIGARLSRRALPEGPMAVSLAVAALLAAWLPALAHPVADWFMPRGLGLDEAAGLLVWGSLAASMVLFLPVAAMLGCIGPLAVESIQHHSGCHAGEAGGRVLAASTIGSLTGTFATTHWLLPQLGVRWTFHLAAAILALSSALIFRFARARGEGGSLLAPARLRLPALIALWGLTVGGIALARHERPAPSEGDRLLAEASSPYQALRVIERGEGAERVRLLQANESLDSFQSIWQPEVGLLSGGSYYDLFSLPPNWAYAEASRARAAAHSGAPADANGNEEGAAEPSPTPLERWRVLILGLGAGTTVRVLEGAVPPGLAVETVGLEIDPVVLELGREWFELVEGPTRRVAVGDARACLRGLEEEFDQIVVDCYANNMEIPPHLATREFFEELVERLVPGGWLSINAAGFGLDDPVVRAVAAATALAIEASSIEGAGPAGQARLLGLRVPFSRNCILIGRRGASPPEPTRDAWWFDSRAHDELLGRLRLPGAWRWMEGDPAIAPTDERCAIELLQLESVLSGRQQWYGDE